MEPWPYKNSSKACGHDPEIDYEECVCRHETLTLCKISKTSFTN